MFSQPPGASALPLGRYVNVVDEGGKVLQAMSNCPKEETCAREEIKRYVGVEGFSYGAKGQSARRVTAQIRWAWFAVCFVMCALFYDLPWFNGARRTIFVQHGEGGSAVLLPKRLGLAVPSWSSPS